MLQKLTPLACSAWIIATNGSIIWRCTRRVAVPSDGTSRIQLSVMAGADSAQAIHASTACRTWRVHGASWSTAAVIWRIISLLDSVSSATKQASLSEKCA